MVIATWASTGGLDMGFVTSSLISVSCFSVSWVTLYPGLDMWLARAIEIGFTHIWNVSCVGHELHGN